MAVAFIQEFPIEGDDRSTANYDAISQRLGAADNPPEGAILHTAGFDEDAGVFRIFEVWESQEQAERFINGQVMPLVIELAGEDAAAPQRQSFYELHGLMRG
jgi:hypothetical protein